MSKLLSGVVAVAMAVSGGADAAIQNESLPWSRPGEQLFYSGCGCADSCWVAELRDKRTHALKARLRCDCETVFFSKGAEKERVYAATCEAFHGDDKFDLITHTVEALTR